MPEPEKSFQQKQIDAASAERRQQQRHEIIGRQLRGRRRDDFGTDQHDHHQRRLREREHREQQPRRLRLFVPLELNVESLVEPLARAVTDQLTYKPLARCIKVVAVPMSSNIKATNAARDSARRRTFHYLFAVVAGRAGGGAHETVQLQPPGTRRESHIECIHNQ